MEDSEKPPNEEFVSTESVDQKVQKSCLNCGAPLTGKYCPSCGQRDLPARQDLGDMIINFISSFYSFESKFFKTFSYLLFKPGKIVADYNAGKRESYYHPARMYVFLSFVFFLLVSIFSTGDELDLGDGDLTAADSVALDSMGIKADSLMKFRGNGFNFNYQPVAEGTDTPEAKTVAEYDSIQKALPEEQRDGFIQRYFERKSREIEEKEKGGKGKELGQQFIDETVSNIPTMLFYLMPILALILKLLYIRRDYFYSEHLIFTVFYYDFIYLMGSLVILVQQVEWISWLQYILFLWMYIYLYKSMRNVYKQRRSKTIVKFLLLLFMFFFCAVVGFVIIFLIAFANL